MVETVDTHCELPQAHLFEAKELATRAPQPLNDPVWTDVYDHLRDDDPVLGLYLGRRAWALPWWIMRAPSRREPRLRRSARGRDALRDVQQRVGLSGGGRRAASRSFVCEGSTTARCSWKTSSTDSLWSPFTGVALAGAMRGAALKRLPLSQCLWSEWLAMHPTTMVLYAEQALREGRGSHFHPVRPASRLGFSPRSSGPSTSDSRTTRSSSASRTRAKARAYPLQALARIGPVLNDSLGGAEIVLRCRPGTLQALAFHRRVGDRILVFGYSEARGVYDEQTGSVWNEMGEAISGPLAGTQLAYLESGVGEWYEFAACHPQHGDLQSAMIYTDQQIFDTLARFFTQEEAGREGAIVVAPDTDIIAEGLVDSLGIFKLIAFVEEKFAVSIEPDEVLIENFQTLRAVRNLIVKKLPP